MVSEFEIPEPADSGSDGSQIKADTTNGLVPSRPVAPPMARAIVGLAASNSRAFGGEIASVLIAGATSQMSTELDESKKELAVLRKKIERIVGELSDERVAKAVLVERIEAYRSTRHLKNIGIAVGTLLLGTGIQLIRNEAGLYGLACVVIGALLLLLGWHSAPKGGEK